MAIRQTDQRLFKGTTVEIMAFVPAPFDGWTYAESTDTNFGFRWDGTEWNSIGPNILFGTYGNPATGTPKAGNRPLASSVPHGTQWIPQDDRIIWTSSARASDPSLSIWLPDSSPSTRSLQATVAGPNAAVAAHFGVYNPTGNTFTPAATLGQNCNASAAQSGASGATIFVILFPATIALSAPYSGVLGAEIMSDGTGFVIPYDAVAPHVPLGVALVGNGVTANLAVMLYEY